VNIEWLYLGRTIMVTGQMSENNPRPTVKT
jgi:hypothetical protein